MKKSVYKMLGIAAACLVLSAPRAGAQGITRNFSKTFTVSPATSVVLSNRYGEVAVETWNRNEVAIEVSVKVDLSDRSRSERLADQIRIEFFENDTAVGATTVLDEKFSVTTRGTGSNRFSIDYTVKMPSSNGLDISNRYGNVKMAEHNGLVITDVRYGNLYVYKLTRGNIKPLNTISVSYGKAVIDEANWLTVTARYSPEVNINTVRALLLDSRYSRITIEKAGSIVADSKYDNLTVSEVNNLVAETGYTPVKIGTLNSKLDLTARYGSFEAASVPAGFESINIDASYTGLNLAISRSASYTLDARVSYGSLTYCEECIEVKRKIVEPTSREIAGTAGKKQNPDAAVIIRSSYGAVRLR